MASGTGGHQSYYVPEQSKFPFLATIGLGMAILGGGLPLHTHTFHGTGGLYWLLPIRFVLLTRVLWNRFSSVIRANMSGAGSYSS